MACWTYASSGIAKCCFITCKIDPSHCVSRPALRCTSTAAIHPTNAATQLAGESGGLTRSTQAGRQEKVFRATRLSSNPLVFVAQDKGAGLFLRSANIILRENHDSKDIFADLIRMATGGVWSHSALLCSLGSPSSGLNETFLIESRPRGTQLVSWRKEVVPFDQFTV